jgi:hypothetical protein
MPLDWPVRAVAGWRDFWERFFWRDGDGRSSPRLGSVRDDDRYNGCLLDLPISQRGSFRIEIFLEHTHFDFSLDQDGRTEDIAWDSQVHWFPHVLRWEELDLIGKSVMVHDPTLPHPGLPFLMLCRYAPLCDGDDADRVYAMLHDAYQRVGITGYLGGVLDARGQGFEWVQDEEGWKLNQNDAHRYQIDLYSLRHVENSDFPHAEFNALIADARAVAATLLEPRWLDSNVTELARVIDAGKDFEKLPILADALMDAGCDNEITLTHCRSSLPGQESSWVVDAVLNKPWCV